MESLWLCFYYGEFMGKGFDSQHVLSDSSFAINWMNGNLQLYNISFGCNSHLILMNKL